MLKKLSTVEAVFPIKNGLIVMPGIPFGEGWKLCVGDPIIIRLSDGKERSTLIAGIETGGGPKDSAPILLRADLITEEVPIGAEIFVETETKKASE